MKRVAAATVVLAALAAGCTAHATTATVRLSITPDRALLDTPVRVTVTGLRPGEHATLTASATDYSNVTWHSSATFAASPTGVVTTNESPLSGSYDGADPMGLFDRMSPINAGSDDLYFDSPDSGYQISVTVSAGGRRLATKTIRRDDPFRLGVHELKFRPPSSPFYGDMFLPAHTGQRRPAVLLFGGSEGGLSGFFVASLLAAHGYPAMALAYFDEPGLPKHLDQIPLEYFVKALHELRHAPGTDPERLVVWGVSRGSEAALLLGAHFPNLVHGVVAGVPSSVVNGSLPDGAHSAWSLNGRPLPFASALHFHDPTPPDRRAVIPVEEIRGPILLVCGGSDILWPSCDYATAIVRRLKAHGRASEVTRLDYPTAGHGVGAIVPYVSVSPDAYKPDRNTHGGTLEGDVLGRIDAWHHILAMLARLK